MFLRSIFAAGMVLLLSGCAGWAAETRLIPISERSQAGLAGTYSFDDGRAVLTPGKDGFVHVTDHKGKDPGDLAFALLREEAPDPQDREEAHVDGETPVVARPDRSYLMEIPWSDDSGGTGYFYTIVRIAFSADGSADEVTQFTVLCSKAAQKLAARKEGQQCIFDDYARLKAAALDALAWYDDPRMALETSTLQAERAEAPAPE